MTREIEYERKIKKFVTVAFKIFFGILIAILIALLLGYVIMWLWNWLMPDLFGLPTVGYWKAVGILVLAKFLFGGLGGHHSGKSKDKSRRRCRPKETMPFKGDFSKWKHYEKFWEAEGETAYKAYVERLEQEDK